MHQTKNDISLETRTKVVALLNARLADAIDLTLQGKQAHWNVKGPQFIALHELFDKVVESAEDWVDDLAERVVALGGVAEGTVGAVGKKTTLAAYPIDISDGPEHVDALSSALAKFGTSFTAPMKWLPHCGAIIPTTVGGANAVSTTARSWGTSTT